MLEFITYRQAYHSLEIEDVYVLVVLSITPIPPKQYCSVFIHHGQGEARTGRGPCPSDCRGGPCPYDKSKDPITTCIEVHMLVNSHCGLLRTH